MHANPGNKPSTDTEAFDKSAPASWKNSFSPKQVMLLIVGGMCAVLITLTILVGRQDGKAAVMPGDAVQNAGPK